ncbi:MAG: hypothetical protein WCP39_06905 [Chlamydiota bacterium]
MITDYFDPSNNTLVVVLSGEIAFDEVFDWIKTVTPARVPVRKLKMLSDGSEAKYSFSKKQVQQSDIAITELTGRFETIKNAVIHITPIETAFSFLARDAIKYQNYLQQTFSTKEAALEWLLAD